MLKWLKRRIARQFIDKDRCGRAPLRTGPWDPFHGACKTHDGHYITKHIPQKQADALFYNAVRDIIDTSAWYTKPLLYIWGNAYIRIVKIYAEQFPWKENSTES